MSGPRLPELNDFEHTLELLRSIRDCFFKRGRWWMHKSNDGEVVEVSEDLHDYLEEADELVEEFLE